MFELGGVILYPRRITKHSPLHYFKTSPEMIRFAVILYIRFPISLRNVEDLLNQRGIDISHEKIRSWWSRFGLMFASEIVKKRANQVGGGSNWQWHLDEIFVKINSERHYLWRAVDHECEVLESYVRKRRDRKFALKFVRKSMMRHVQPRIGLTDKLRSFCATMRVIGNATGKKQGVG